MCSSQQGCLSVHISVCLGSKDHLMKGSSVKGVCVSVCVCVCVYVCVCVWRVGGVGVAVVQEKTVF